MMNRATSAELDRSAARSRVVDELGPWATGTGPVYRQLARAIARAVERGALGGGFRLPSERSLAAALAVSRGTAVAAYDLLVGDGVVERRPGSGTFVAVGLGPTLPADREGSTLVHRLVDESAGRASGIIDLSLSVLHDVGDLPLSLPARDLAGIVPDTGYSPWGLPGLRAQLAARVARWGIDARPDQVVVTTGAQQAISASAACWVRPGDTVVVEDPTYPGAIAAYRQAGATLVGLPMDRRGVDVGALERALRDRPALVYLQSGVHSPTGTVLAESRRREIARLLGVAGVPLVEDVALADLTWERLPPSIAALGPSRRGAPVPTVAVVGSLSKVFWGGLRVGFAVAPPPVALRFARVKATQDLGSSVVSQALAQRLLSLTTDDAFGADRRRELRSRADVLDRELRRALPSWSWSSPGGGLSLWVRLPGADAAAFASTALRHGVAVATPAPLSPTAAHRDRVRLAFSLPPPELREGVRRLAEAWAAHGA